MKLLKSMILTAAALSCTSVFAQDGSERGNQAATKMRIAQEIRLNEQQADKATEYVRSEDKSRSSDAQKSDG
ncbi:hypothetical protein NVV30_06500 [Pseudomonas syringae]|uniref:hypothetical protein n=1 Tax=Pseudomonas syringae TaxID=317 RepID=UPI00215A61D9|nr:hypothetical protein [Pseudomonas syringae]MCR8718341.1 hypothetical protein [Pseudomonas syringae]